MCSGAAPPYLTVTPRCQPRNPVTDAPILNERKETPRLHWGGDTQPAYKQNGELRADG